jgi:hypothetical protein
MSSVPLDKTLDEYAEESWQTQGKGQEGICRNLPYSGFGAYHYRESLGPRIKSGGKSGFPDWLFIPTTEGKYTQVISFPGHHKITDFAKNQSIPTITAPNHAIYLVDPNVEQFNSGVSCGNQVIGQVHVHLNESLRLEKEGLRVKWVLSKTPAEQLEENKRKAIQHYSPQDYKPSLREIARRVPNLLGFDSYTSSKEEMLQVLE